MKKIIAIFIVTVALSAGILNIPNLVETYIPQTSITRLQDIDYADTVSAKGEVSKKDSQNIRAEMPLVVSKVLLKSGDTVAVNQPVISVNRTETAKKIMQSNDYSSYAALGAGTSITSYDDVLALIPTEVKSDIAGTIDNVNVSQGDFVAKDAAMMSLIGSDGLVVNASVSENDISDVQVGQAVSISGSGFPRKYSGVVETIADTAKKEYVGTTEDTIVEVKIRFTDADENIRVGYTANVKILTSDKKNIAIVPYEVVMEDDNDVEYVYVFNQGIAVRKDIKTGLELSQGVEVVSGVTPEENILVSPDKVTEGKYVRVVNED